MSDNSISRVDRPLSPEMVFDRHWLVRCTVNILIVTDGSGGFGTVQGFHLGLMLQALADDPWSHVVFRVTGAHRQMSAEAGVIDNFRFDAHDLSQYSQIWLFGVERTFNPLSAGELAALAAFMEAGGGVFATGDHENLGFAMCAGVPRVRSMRRWHWPNPGPDGEPEAPDQTGADRHDTVMNLGVGGNQSDKTPQPIRPRWYSRTTGGGIIRRVHTFPHPVLCGPDGVIEYLPDHMHEGLCEVPADLGRPLLPGSGALEYPDVGGTRPLPEVIAWATTRNTDNSDFGVLAAYDGHSISKGRVLVDATWHHWFNINLTGFVAASDPANPAYDPAIVPKWEAIKAYFRNVGLWLARPSLQSCIRNGGWFWALGYYDIRITFREPHLVKSQLVYYWQLGVFAKDALGRLASRCQRTRWIIDWLVEIDLPFRVDPWWQFGPRDPRPIDPPDWLDLDDFEAVVLGAGIHKALEDFGGLRDLDARQKLLVDRDGEDLGRSMLKGAADGVRALADRMGNAPGEAQAMLKAFGG